MALTVKQHDLRPYLVAALQQPAGVTIDLTDATSVSVIMRPQGSTAAPVLKQVCEVLDETAGIVRYKWAAGDTDTVGDYDVEWEIMWGAEPMTVPTVGYYTVHIVDDLDL